ncbi:anhydro-N-acetylmuramic acid kinase [Paenibacillus sp. N1-5-1-14]|uniref:anhydro-N-acetylmuramic acid kinase n=1 Tax=Paenibacillus radicibacter TaxID=2972488 RepID=UPI002158F31E|nr:anhydro-N-acetylmuramic acid kinase [Paenibacillus radicibacter]MCR8645528.1 anhydro-N-acetylmuramic acid kinase [Paenibacillus radicibacter]
MFSTLQAKAERLVVGLMSGTSLDGIDAAIVRLEGKGIRTKAELVHFESYAYEDAFREKLKLLCSPDHSRTPHVCAMNFELGNRFADAVLETVARAGLTMNEIDLVSSHGQTIWHIPSDIQDDPYGTRSTLQIGDISVIAKQTGKPVVGDYRTADMAVGGQGAPLTPYVDYILFRDEEKGRIVQNIGGIGNCASLPAGGAPNEVIAFDTGPGNMIIDQAVYQLSNGSKSYDAGGEWASAGTVQHALLDEMLQHPYFNLQPVKTTGREMFGKQYANDWLARALEINMRPEDIIATFTAFTARSIADSYKQFIFDKQDIHEVLVSGGGAHNVTLMRMLAEYLPNQTVMSSDSYGITGDSKEAVAFAIFGDHYMFGVPNNLPAATGAQIPTVMGKLALP